MADTPQSKVQIDISVNPGDSSAKLQEVAKGLTGIKEAAASAAQPTAAALGAVAKGVEQVAAANAATGSKSGVDRVADGLEKVSAAAQQAGSSSARLTEQIKAVESAARLAPEAAKGLAAVEAAAQGATDGTAWVGGLASALGQLASAIPGGGAAMLRLGSTAGMLAAAFANLKRGVDEFAESEAGVAKLESVLANLGMSTEENRGRLRALSEELERATGIADDRWLATITKLIQAGANPASIGMDAEAVKNLTGLIGDLDVAAGLYIRALQGNFEAFGRYGILVREAGTQTENLQAVQEQAAQRGAGVLEASTHTLSGEFKALKNSASNAFESIGQWVAKTGLLQAALWGAKEVLTDFADATAQAYQSLGLVNNQASDTAGALQRYRAAAGAVLEQTKASVLAMEGEVQALRAKQIVLDQLADKQAALKKATIDLAVAERTISPEDGIRRKAQVDLDLAADKATREKATALAELQGRRNEVVLLAGQKAATDADLARERKALVPEERLQSIRRLVASLRETQAEEKTASAIAPYDVTWVQKEGEADAWDRDGVERQSRMSLFGENVLERLSNRAGLRRGRIAELERMSAELGANLSKSRGFLATEAPLVRARVLGSEMDADTAKARAQGDIAGADRKEFGDAVGRLSRGAKNASSVSMEALQAAQSAQAQTTDLLRAMVRNMEGYGREIRQIQAAQKNALNR